MLSGGGGMFAWRWRDLSQSLEGVDDWSTLLRRDMELEDTSERISNFRGKQGTLGGCIAGWGCGLAGCILLQGASRDALTHQSCTIVRPKTADRSAVKAAQV